MWCRRRWLRLSLSQSRRSAERVLLIAPPSSYRISPYVEAARRLGVEPWVVSQGEHSLVGDVAAGLHVDLSRPEQSLQRILDAVRDRPVAGVVGTDDATVALASRAAAALGLIHNAPESALLSRRKDLARARLAQAGVPVPAHRVIDLDRPLAPQCEGLSFPCVVKPLSLSGSRGVIRADDPDTLAAACRRSAAIVACETALPKDERRRLLVESFVPGPELALEGMLEGGCLRLLALFDKPDPLDGPFFEETYYITPSRLDAQLQARVAQRVAEACAAYGLREGPVHAELRLHDGEAWILEVAARTIGGQCARLLRFGAGVGLEELVLTHVLGRRSVSAQASGAAGVLMIPIPRAGLLRRVEGVLAARKVAFVEEVEISVREGYELVPLPEGASYLGFIFARAPTPAQAEAALRAAHACLNVVTAPLLSVQAGVPSAPGI